MSGIVQIYKNEGETPLECLERFRVEQPLYKDATLSYAGRLDPMAEGILLVLVGEENKKRADYLGLDKTYEVEILFGMETDTGDILGVVGKDLQEKALSKDFSEAGLASILNYFIGNFTQQYPHYSSKTVDGKPLFQWAREGRIGEIEIPERTSEVYSIENRGTFEMTGKEILKSVKERIVKVKGDFRQQEVLISWQKMFEKCDTETFRLIRIRVECSSGTYMRSLASAIAQKRGTSGLAWRIKRILVHQDKDLHFVSK